MSAEEGSRKENITGKRKNDIFFWWKDNRISWNVIRNQNASPRKEYKEQIIWQ